MKDEVLKEYELTVGLEIHAELKTETKMFCQSKNDPDEDKPNVNVCPICMGHPGTLPVINKEAVKHVIKVGVAVGGKIADYTEFDRKHYFYPDIPKGYQISQYKNPLVQGGEINGVQLTRIHLEEDTGTSLHDKGDYSLVSYNRAGVPLMELVTEPVIKSAEQAANFAKELQLLLRYLDAGEANMEKGEMRIEANISVAKKGSDKFGTKVEVKNLNSFKSVQKSIEFEFERQIALIEKGEKVEQETRGFDENSGKTFLQRRKESSHDYRYFPDPDLPKLKISEISEFNIIKESMPELPWQKRKRYFDLGIQQKQIETIVEDLILADYFDKVSESFEGDKKLIQKTANYLTSDLLGMIQKKNILISDAIKNISTNSFADLIKMTESGELSSRGAKDTLAILLERGGDAKNVAKESGLIQQRDENAIKKVIEEVIKENPLVVEEYKAGKEASLQFLIGQVMKKSKGSADPLIAKKALETLVKS